MAQTTRTRLQPEIFDLPVEKMRAGWYTDAYFNHARDTLLRDERRPRVVLQIFQKEDAWLGGMDEAIAILKLCANEYEALEVLKWKDIVQAMEAALNTVEDVSNVVESIVLKHA